VQYLDNTDAQGDPQAQVRQANQTDAQAYAIDAANIGPKGSPPVNNDAAKASTPAQNKVLAQVEKLNDNDRVKLKNAIGKILTSGAAKASTTGAAAPAPAPAPAPATKPHTGGKVKGQVSQTPNAIRKRAARLKAKGQPA